MPLTPAPVGVFAYRRPEHLRRVLDALEANRLASETSVTIFCDGPRSSDDPSLVADVVREASRPRGFGSLHIRRRSSNAGLAGSIIQGVTSMLDANESVIVLEDDLLPSPGFLTYMNEGLVRYAEDERVVSVHGYAYPTDRTAPFFLRGADCWGWGTWRRGWALFDADGKRLLGRLRQEGLERQFDLDGRYPFTAMLEKQAAGQVDSWAIRWHASAFLAGRLTLYPGRSLICNIGADGSGTHVDSTRRFDGELAAEAPDLEDLLVEESLSARRMVAEFLGGPRHHVGPRPVGTRSLLAGIIGRMTRRHR